MVSVLGVDEARRGSVIGDMIICGALINEQDEYKLKKLGVKDSKLLSQKRKEWLFPKILKIIKNYEAKIITPKELDKAVGKEDGLNLNWLEAHKTAEIINKLNPNKAIIDCPSPNIRKYKEFLLNLLKNKNVELIVENHAEKYMSVAAASVIAKVIAEEQLKKLKKEFKVEFGSGYTSDPRTQKFVRENFDKYPGIFRKSWMTYKNHEQAKKQRKLEEF
jgi:ribonuclease HII